jgi:hypothetical protein
MLGQPAIRGREPVVGLTMFGRDADEEDQA